MDYYGRQMSKLIEQLSSLPGILAVISFSFGSGEEDPGEDKEKENPLRVIVEGTVP